MTIGHPSDIAQIREGSFSVGNLPVYRCVNELTGPDDVEEFGECDVYMSLGLTSKPFPPTSGTDNDGAAEAVVLRDCGNTDGVVIGANDARCAFVYGSLNDGDTVVHSVDPDASAQLQVKANRQVAMFTKNTDGQSITIALDGKNNKVQIGGSGLGMILMDKAADTIAITAPGGGCSIQMKGDTISLIGKIVLGGLTPANVIMGGPPGTTGSGSAPIPGLFGGT